MANGLPVSSVVSVSVSMSAIAASERDFGVGLILGDSNTIDTEERLRLYKDIDSVAEDFGTSAPEYLAAVEYFSADPGPAQCYIGRWAKTATSGTLKGKILGTADQNIELFKAVTNGGFSVNIDGSPKTLSAIDLQNETNLNGVASKIQAALDSAGTCVWNGQQFVIQSLSTGSTSTVTSVSSTQLSQLMGLDSGTTSVPGIAAETLLDAVTILADMSDDWYGLLLVADTDDQSLEDVADFIDATSTARIMGITTQDTSVLNASISTDIASVLKAKNNNRVFVQYSSYSKYAACAAFGRAFTVNFSGENTTITLKFKQEVGIQPEILTATQANILKNKNCNVFVQYSNDTAIIQEGVMSGGWFFDERHGLDWLQNTIQTAVWNLLYTSTTKIPQTDAGVNRIVSVIESRMNQAVTNGLLAPGTWNGDSFGALNTGDTLTSGYYVYALPLSSQSQSERETRQAPAIQCAAKLAGAIHFADIAINVNR